MPDPQALQKTSGDGALPQDSFRAAPIESLEGQVTDIQKVMDGLMQEGTHYDDVTGDGRNSLLQPGAEKLCMAFKFAPSFDVERRDYAPDEVPNAEEPVEGHREYIVNCQLHHRPSGQYVGSGRGSCSTLESKYRYRKVEEETEIGIPSAFWDSYDKDAGENMGDADFSILEDELINSGVSIPEDGETGVTKNDDGDWRITVKVEGENPDIADLYNTVLKMAEKRALVNAVKRSTAASDIFTQDTEDLQHLDGSDVQGQRTRRAQSQQKRRPSGKQGKPDASGSRSSSDTPEAASWEAPTGNSYTVHPKAAQQLQKAHENLSGNAGADLAAMVEKCRAAYDWTGREGEVMSQLLDYHEQRLADTEAQAAEEAQAQSDAAPQPPDSQYDGPGDALQSVFDAAWKTDANADWDSISEAQLTRMHAIAAANDWDEAELNRLIKDELGWASKADVPYGDPYDEICEGLEDERLRYHMSRDPDTPDMFSGDGSSEEANHEAFESDDGLPF